MPYYSFIAIAKHPVSVEVPMVALDTGVNAFSALVPDLDEFIDLLHKNGVTVREANRLDEFEENKPSDILLPGERSEKSEVLAPAAGRTKGLKR